jgi:hypothetical protein
MSLMSGISGTHRHARGRGPLDTWQSRSPPAPGGGSGATGHVPLPEPCQAVVLALQGTWRHRSRVLVGGAPCVLGHVATPEPSPGGWRALCYEARGDVGALSRWVACSVPRSTWQCWSPLASGAGLEPWGWSFMSCAQGYLVCRVPMVSFFILLGAKVTG